MSSRKTSMPDDDFRPLLEKNPHCTLAIDQGLCIRYASKKIFGYSKEKLIGMNLDALLASIGLADVIDMAMRVLQKGKDERILVECSTGKKERKICDLSISVLHLPGRKKWLGIFVCVLSSKQYEDYSRLEREKERVTIAQELHDDMGQILTAMKYHIATGCKNKDMKNGVLQLVDSAINRLRQFLFSLRPFLPEEIGLVEAIGCCAEEIQRLTGIKYKMEISLQDKKINSAHAGDFFRIVQESFTNIMRHSKATEVKVAIKNIGESICLRISDNGVGISSNKSADFGTMGIAGMRNRAKSMGGTISIRGVKGKGTTINMKVPAKVLYGKSPKNPSKTCCVILEKNQMFV